MKKLNFFILPFYSSYSRYSIITSSTNLEYNVSSIIYSANSSTTLSSSQSGISITSSVNDIIPCPISCHIDFLIC